MFLKVKIHRGLIRTNNIRKPEEAFKVIEFDGHDLSDLMKTLNLNEESVGLVVKNGRMINKVEKARVKPNDKIEFYPHLIGG